MNRQTLPNLQASQAIEELLAGSNENNSQQNWLLSYLDVFVLIVMLVITLLAITDIPTPSQPKQSERIITKKPNKFSRKETIQKKSKKNQPKLVKKLPPKPVVQSKTIPLNEPVLTSGSQTSEVKKPLHKLNTSKLESNPEININKPVKTEEEKLQPEKKTPPQEKGQETEKLWQDQLRNKLDSQNLNQFVNVNIKEGYAQIEIQDNILFDSAKAELTDDGKGLIEKLTTLLKQSAGLIFIEGHTDNQPIATEKFPSNWELGSARATSVLHFLTSQNLDSRRLRAVTYADTMPLEDNSTEQGRSRNRRVSLLVKIPEP